MFARCAGFAAGFAAVWMVLVALAPPASAHAELVRTSPTDRQRLDTPPRAVVLEFTEQVQPVVTRLLDADGRPVSTGELRTLGRSLLLPLPPDLPRGVYVVTWRVVSSDTHPVSGAFAFGIGVEPGSLATAPPPAGASGAEVALMLCRWIGYAGLALILGGSVFLVVCWPAGRALARRTVAAGWVAAVATPVLALLVHGPYLTGRPLVSALDPRLLADTAGTRFGLLHLARLCLLLALARPLRAILTPGHRPGRAALGAAVLLAGVVATYVGAGHAAAGERRALAMVSDGLHLAAMSLWAGGLVLLAACALRPRHRPTLGDALTRFSRLALGSVGVLAATGLFQTWRQVGSFAGLTGTPYGRLLLVKIALFTVLLVLGALAMRAVRGDAAGRLRRIVPIEVACLAVVLGLTAVLVTMPPARHAEATAAGGSAHAVLSLPDGGTAEVHVAPAAVGPNQVRIVVRDQASRARAVPEMTMRVSLPGRGLGPFEVPLRSHGSAGYGGEMTLFFAGAWRLDLALRTSDIDAYVVTTTIRVGAAKPVTHHHGGR
ncbi:hypothetical protein LI90_2002 [Carbonactinospora thermoautotrophica]|uniref:Copper resistance protein CopC n=1 Tax=Carbonactinospora thermoautotrophica TaxID=1469144 RepID=A0A132MT51_9ACTN|nr:copper resistance protein CopC [Carbonactinospora thermoautotrophica]KWX00974.1 hypothetical protein LI90_2002 [Carbonactinospora thermoautotrophica]